MAESDTPERRIFTFEQARALLPEVRRITETAHAKVEGLRRSLAEGRLEPEAAQQAMDAELEDWARRLVALGIEVKGLWLVDFDNGSGYYCWQYPEASLEHYHSYADGFRGRMRIQ